MEAFWLRLNSSLKEHERQLPCVKWVVETETVLGLFICIHMPMEITIGAH